MNNSVLLLNEQKIYRKHEFKEHMEKGDFDEMGNLIGIHPKCEFCNEHFFNDDKLVKHMKMNHEKCHLCKKKEYKNYYY